jgi:hypothetical protein
VHVDARLRRLKKQDAKSALWVKNNKEKRAIIWERYKAKHKKKKQNSINVVEENAFSPTYKIKLDK